MLKKRDLSKQVPSMILASVLTRSTHAALHAVPRIACGMFGFVPLHANLASRLFVIALQGRFHISVFLAWITGDAFVARSVGRLISLVRDVFVSVFAL